MEPLLNKPKHYKLRVKEQGMAHAGIQFAKDNEYYTPKDFVERFGKFDYDPATTKEKAEEFGIVNYDTIETDGLSSDWSGYERIWCNPPFTKKHEFLKKAVKTYKDNLSMGKQCEIYVLFPIEFMTTKRFHDIIGDLGGTLYLPNGRVKFSSGIGRKTSSPAFGSVVYKLGEGEFKIERMVL